MTLKQSFSDWLVPKLHRVSALRGSAKQLFRGWTLQQSFHEGVICLDAVEHSWAWTGSHRYETFDRELQDKLLLLSQDCGRMLDIGCNIGVMTLSVLLRNPTIKATCVEPNSRANVLFKKSVHLNRLTERINTIEAVVADMDGFLTFDECGSVTGHVNDSGRQVPSIEFVRFIEHYSSYTKCLVKIDIEGFETILMQQLTNIKYLHNLYLVIELHPLYFNKVGDPSKCLKLLLESGAVIEDLQGKSINKVENNNVIQVFAKWLYEI